MRAAEGGMAVAGKGKWVQLAQEGQEGQVQGVRHGQAQRECGAVAPSIPCYGWTVLQPCSACRAEIHGGCTRLSLVAGGGQEGQERLDRRLHLYAVYASDRYGGAGWQESL